MVQIEKHVIENTLIGEIEKLKGLSGINPAVEINNQCKPGSIGVRSQVLVDIMGVLEEILGINIPNNCYIFRDRDGITELTIQQASEKLIKNSTYAKE